MSADLTVQRGTPPAAAVPGAPGRRGRRARRVNGYRAGGLVVLLLLAAVMIYPLVWMVLTSLRPANTVFGGPFIPAHFTFSAYARAWDQVDLGRHFLNSIVITAVTVAGTLVLATAAGYAFAKLRFPLKNLLYFTLLSTLMMPATALIIPLYLQLKTFHLLDQQGGLILLYIGGAAPFAMFLTRAFFETLPNELIEAARVDGANELTIFWRVMLPLARPGIATVVIFQFLSTWNEFLYANTVIQTTGKLPLQPMLFTLAGQYATNWPVLTAALTMSILPIIIVYVRMQRQFVTGLTLGAVKN